MTQPNAEFVLTFVVNVIILRNLSEMKSIAESVSRNGFIAVKE
jgi:hypothetical protein